MLSPRRRRPPRSLPHRLLLLLLPYITYRSKEETRVAVIIIQRETSARQVQCARMFEPEFWSEVIGSLTGLEQVGLTLTLQDMFWSGGRATAPLSSRTSLFKK